MTAKKNPDIQKSAVKTVVDYIANQIYSGALKAGDKIPTESELCTTLGISRTSVREAVKILEAQTVLRAQQGSGTYISLPGEISFSIPLHFKIKLEGIPWIEIISFRMQMEFLVLREAIQNATAQDIDYLDAINSKMRIVRKMKPVPVDEVERLELDFHEKLLALVHNRLLKEMYNISSEIFNPTIAKLYNYTAEGVDDNEWPDSHTYFLDAIRKRDIFLAYQVSMNLIPIERWVPILGESQYTPADKGIPRQP